MPSWLADPIHRVCKQICAIILTLPGRPPVEPEQADPAERRGADPAALGEGEGGAGKAAGQSVGAERSQRVRGVRLRVPARCQDHAGGAGRQRQVGRI